MYLSIGYTGLQVTNYPQTGTVLSEDFGDIVEMLAFLTENASGERESNIKSNYTVELTDEVLHEIKKAGVDGLRYATLERLSYWLLDSDGDDSSEILWENSCYYAEQLSDLINELN